ncbi:hypothetical protein [Caulobacter sp. FWC26]|uniref:hypothetical protein n=1 Tax=Caulobacter sp. FWC26 TaxID=69665 RepID=UPI000C155112|nr:hypothetical protein [Caulobacter sp. FWC26]AZS20061.1 hypothetical protein CSW63_05025 [Caulobacter sp. FWC26]
MSKAAAVKQSDVKRYVKGALEAGFPVGEIVIQPTGDIVLRSAPTGHTPTSKNNSLDRKYGA